MVYFVFGVGLVFTNVRDTLKSTRNELTQFYETKLDSCIIIDIEQRKYPSRGYYSVFYTNCSHKYFPVLIDDNPPYLNKALIEAKAIVIKDSFSTDLTVINNGITTKFKIKNPKDEDDRWSGSKVLLIFMLIGTILIIISPDSLFNKK